MKILWILITSNITFTLSVALYKYDLEELDNAEALRKSPSLFLPQELHRPIACMTKLFCQNRGKRCQ